MVLLRRTRASGAVAALCVFAFASPARAASRDVVVIGGGSAFQNAVTVALSAWELHVVSAEATAPSPEQPRASREARAIADRHAQAAGVVWVGTSHDNEHALFIYDRETDQLVSRPLSQGPPFDAPSAASAALSVKTLLRSSTVAPPSERIGAETAPAPSPPPSPSRAPAAPEGEASSPIPSPVEDPRVMLEVGGSARAVAGRVDARIGAGATYWLDASRRVGVALVGHAGPGLAIDAPRFRGRFDELSLSPSLRLRVPLTPQLRLEPRAGMTLHGTRIDGVAMTTAEPATRDRLDASLSAGIVLEIALSRMTRLGLDLEGAWVMRYQRYLVSAEQVFELDPLQGSAGLRLAVGLP